MPPPPPHSRGGGQEDEYCNGVNCVENGMSKKRGYVNGMDRREQYIDELNSMKRRRLAMLSDQKVCAPKYDKTLQGGGGSGSRGGGETTTTATNQMSDAKQAPGLSNDNTTCQYQNRRGSIMNYIIQLAHSEDFKGFVEEFERGLESALHEDDNIRATLGF